jgi:hypothetical protein
MTADRRYRNNGRIKSDLDRGTEMTRFSNLLFGVALVSGIAIIADAAVAFAQRNAQRIALQSGESTTLRNYYYIVNCRSILLDKPVLDVLEGPEEVTVEIKEGPVLPRAQNCPNTVPGGAVVAIAKDVTEPKVARLTIRLKFNTKAGERQDSNTYLVSLFPGKPRAGGLLSPTPSMNPMDSGAPTSPQ